MLDTDTAHIPVLMADRYSSYILLLSLIFGLLSARTASAQSRPADRPLYLRAHLGITRYGGDLNHADREGRSIGAPAIGWAMGYQVSSNLSLSVALQAGDYPHISPSYSWHTWRFNSEALLQWTFEPVLGIFPYVRLGGSITTGSNEPSDAPPGFGPVATGGALYPVSSRISFFMETTFRSTFPDEAADGIAEDRPFDTLGFIGTGLRFRLSSLGDGPIQLSGIQGRDTLQQDEEAVFTPELEREAGERLTYHWDFGDGSTATGSSVRHTYTQPGTYTVELTASAPEKDTDGEKAALEVNVVSRSRASAGRTSACMSALETAESAYRSRQFDRAIDSLSTCLNDEVAPSGKVGAFRLRTLIYLKRGQIERAKGTLLQLLAVQPDYTADSVQDPPAYVSLVSLVRQQLESDQISLPTNSTADN